MGTTIPAGKRLRAKWEGDEPAFGLWAGIPSSITAELAALAGYDYVCVDLQHGLGTEATMVSISSGRSERRSTSSASGILSWLNVRTPAVPLAAGSCNEFIFAVPSATLTPATALSSRT